MFLQGNFTNTRVELAGNQFTRFDSSVFQNMLTQMGQPGALGYVTLSFQAMPVSISNHF